MTPIRNLVVSVAAACLLTSEALAVDSKWARRQKAETMTLLTKAAWLIQRRESITPRQLEQGLPGRYTARELSTLNVDVRPR